MRRYSKRTDLLILRRNLDVIITTPEWSDNASCSAADKAGDIAPYISFEGQSESKDKVCIGETIKKT